MADPRETGRTGKGAKKYEGGGRRRSRQKRRVLALLADRNAIHRPDRLSCPPRDEIIT